MFESDIRNLVKANEEQLAQAAQTLLFLFFHIKNHIAERNDGRIDDKCVIAKLLELPGQL